MLFDEIKRIYNKQIGDLLDPTHRNLETTDDAKHGFYVENLSEEFVTGYEDATQILIKGLSNRKVGATSINSKSSKITYCVHMCYQVLVQGYRFKAFWYLKDKQDC